jgi:hypothetical protein
MKVSVDQIEKHTGDCVERAPEDDRTRADTRPLKTSASGRPFGLAAGEFVVPDDFDDPLSDDLLDLFEGRSDS